MHGTNGIIIQRLYEKHLQTNSVERKTSASIRKRSFNPIQQELQPYIKEERRAIAYFKF